MDPDPETSKKRELPQAAPAANGDLKGPDGEQGSRARTYEELQEELGQLRDLLAMVQEERDQYRQILYPPIWGQFSEEELRRFATDESMEGCQTLDQFLPELEAILNRDEET